MSIKKLCQVFFSLTRQGLFESQNVKLVDKLISQAPTPRSDRAGTLRPSWTKAAVTLGQMQGSSIWRLWNVNIIRWIGDETQNSNKLMVGSPFLLAWNLDIGIRVDKGSSSKNCVIQVWYATEVSYGVTTMGDPQVPNLWRRVSSFQSFGLKKVDEYLYFFFVCSPITCLNSGRGLTKYTLQWDDEIHEFLSRKLKWEPWETEN